MMIERPLDEVEIRVLGSLLEKQQTTPDNYPLTLNALRAACNQSTNRDPVMSVDDEIIEHALERLQELGLVWKVIGGRALRWDHNLDKRWSLDPRRKALLTLLFLRGPQTAGEIRSRIERMVPFESVREVEALLQSLASEEPPSVVEFPRRPGQKESRWMHLAGAAAPSGVDETPRPPTLSQSLTERIDTLERRVIELEGLVQRLRQSLGED